MAKIYITGDTHIPYDIIKLLPENFLEGESLTEDDFVIVAGDFGLIWDYRGENEIEKKWKTWLNERPWTTLFVDGNHENFTRLNAYPVSEWHGGKIHKISDKIIHLMRGQVFEIDGKKIFTFGGGMSVDRGTFLGTEDLDRGRSWWDEELPTLDETAEGWENLAKHNNKVDFVITHDLPEKELIGLGIRDRRNYYKCYLNTHLDDIRREIKFTHWYSGHYHEDVTLSPTQTILYNNVIELGDMILPPKLKSKKERR